jgi:gas vesicle protein
MKKKMKTLKTIGMKKFTEISWKEFKDKWFHTILFVIALLGLFYLMWQSGRGDTLLKNMQKDFDKVIQKKEDSLQNLLQQEQALRDTIQLLMEYTDQQAETFKKELKAAKKKNKDIYEKSISNIDSASVDDNMQQFRTNFSEAVPSPDQR